MIKRVLISIVLSITILFTGNGQIGLLEINTKDLDGNIKSLYEHLDSNKNHLINLMGFYCAPCIRKIKKINKNLNKWDEEYNLKVTLVEGNHWDDMSYITHKMAYYNWDMDILVSNNIDDTGIYGVPRYYFLAAGSDKLITISDNSIDGFENFFYNNVILDSSLSLFQNSFSQSIMFQNCKENSIQTFDLSNDTMINNNNYYSYNTLYFTDENFNRDIYIYDETTQSSKIYIDYNLPMCGRFTLTDYEGDKLDLRVMDIIHENFNDTIPHLTFVTDKYILDCDNDSIPFKLIKDIGTNAGLLFDIEDGEIVSRLVCHGNIDQIIFLDDKYSSWCQPNKVSDIPRNILKVFPNPSKSNFNISLPVFGTKHIRLFTVNGQLQQYFTTDKESFEIRIDDDAERMYILQILTEDNTYHKKLLKILPY